MYYHSDKNLCTQNYAEPLLVSQETMEDTPERCHAQLLDTRVSSASEPEFINYDEKEESTVIKKLTYLKFRPIMMYFVLPILSILTVFILPIVVYWNKNLQLSLFYKKATCENATHILVEGQKSEVKKITKQGFEFRFIKYEFKDKKFVPVLFNALQSQKNLIFEFGRGLNDEDVPLLREKYGPC